MGVIDKIMDECEAKGRAEGEAKGILAASKEIALRLLNMGTMTVDTVAEVCKMSISQVQELEATIKHS